MDTTRPPHDQDPETGDTGTSDRGYRNWSAGTPDRGTPDRGTPAPSTPDRGTPGSWDQEAESFGAWLCRHRRVRGIELREIAADSKIGMTYLRAFEDDRFDILPAPVFAKGFLRQYANYVGLDPEEVVNFYLSAAQQSQEHDEEGFESATERPRIDPLKLAGLAVGVVVVLILIWFLTRGDGDSSPDPLSPPEETGTAAPAAAEERPAAATADDAGMAAAIPAESSESSPLRLTLDFSGECWVEITIDGERRFAQNKIQGESLVLLAEQAIDVKIGDVDVVEAELNGRPFRFDDTPGTKVRNERIDLEMIAALDNPLEGDR